MFHYWKIKKHAHNVECAFLLFNNMLSHHLNDAGPYSNILGSRLDQTAAAHDKYWGSVNFVVSFVPQPILVSLYLSVLKQKHTLYPAVILSSHFFVSMKKWQSAHLFDGSYCDDKK